MILGDLRGMMAEELMRNLQWAVAWLARVERPSARAISFMILK